MAKPITSSRNTPTLNDLRWRMDKLMADARKAVADARKIANAARQARQAVLRG